MSRAIRDGRVAVIIPVYRARFLAEALESVFDQSRQADEVIVVNDGSPDQYALQAALARYGSRVAVLCQQNSGAGAARNAGIAATTAEFLAFLDADDCWLPDFLRDQLAFFGRRPELDAAYTDGMIMGRTPLAGRTLMATMPSCGDVTFASLLAQRCTVPLSATVARRAAVEGVGCFDAGLRRGQDFDLWLRMTKAGARFAYQRTPLILRRIHDENLSGNETTEIERALKVLDKTLATMALSASERAIAEQRWRELDADLARVRGKELLARGEFAEAYASLARARAGQMGWKLRAALFGLRVAPQLVRRLYVARAAASPAS